MVTGPLAGLPDQPFEPVQVGLIHEPVVMCQSFNVGVVDLLLEKLLVQIAAAALERRCSGFV